MILETETKRIPPDVVVLKFTGKITLGRESARIEMQVADLLNEGNKKFVFDIAAVTYIDSAGLGVIALCSANVNQAGGVFRVAGAQGLAAKLFRITKLDNVIPMFPTVEAATEGLTS